jgi:hypothetical protein
MASIPITITLGTIISILVAAGRGIYGASSLAKDGFDDVKSGPSKILIERCTEIIEDLQQMDHHLLITGRTQRLIQTIVDCLQWARNYDDKNTMSKIIFSNGNKKKFKKRHAELSINFNDLVLSVLLTGIFPDRLTGEKASIY